MEGKSKRGLGEKKLKGATAIRKKKKASVGS